MGAAVFGLSGSLEGCTEELPHCKESAGMSCSFLKTRTFKEEHDNEMYHCRACGVL